MATLGTMLALLASLVGLRAGPALSADPSPAGSAAILVPTDGSAPGPWSAAATDVEIGARGRAFGAWLLYPERDPGADPVMGPVAIAEGPWPVVIFGHGYLTPVELYAETLRALASHGFVVVAPRSGDELFPDHGSFAADFSTVIDWLEAERVRPDSLSELVCDTATIPSETQRAMTVGLLVDWLRLHLGGELGLEPAVWPDDPGDGTTVDSRRP